MLGPSKRVGCAAFNQPFTFLPQVAKWCREQADAAAPAGAHGNSPTRGGGAGSPAASLRTLYLLLQALAQFQGKLNSAPYSAASATPGGQAGKAPATPEAAVAAALLGEEATAGRGSEVSTLVLSSGGANVAAPYAAAEAVGEVQRLLQGGKRQEALRWVGFLLPGAGQLGTAAWTLLGCWLGDPLGWDVVCRQLAHSTHSHFCPHSGRLLGCSSSFFSRRVWALPPFHLPPPCCSDARRVATEAGQWALALLLARLLGDASLAATAAAFVQQSLPPAAPLHTLLLQLAGAGVTWEAREELVASWQQHLAVVAANRTPGDEGLLLQLGQLLAAQGQLLPAHCCYVVAGAHMQPATEALATRGPVPLPALVLVGADPVAQPRR